MFKTQIRAMQGQILRLDSKVKLFKRLRVALSVLLLIWFLAPGSLVLQIATDGQHRVQWSYCFDLRVASSTVVLQIATDG